MHEERLNSNFRLRLGPSGIHLFDRVSGLNVLFDNITIPMTQWASAPRFVSIALTNACDLKCSFCYAPKQPATLDYSVVRGWIKELDESGCLGVGFGGGEPTLYNRLNDLCFDTANHTGLAVTLTTHGHLLDDEFINKLKSNVHLIRISMDGVKKTYESIRGRKFSKLLLLFLKLKNQIPFGINYVVNTQTFLDLDPAIKIAEKYNASEFLLLPEQEVSDKDNNSIDISNVLADWINQYKGDTPLVISEQGVEGIRTSNPFTQERPLFSFVHIDAFGVLKRNSFESEGIKIGQGGFMNAFDKLRNAYQED